MALWSRGISLHKLVVGVKCSAWMATDININVQHDSPFNHGINCGLRNEQVVSQPFLFWFGFSSPPLDMFPFFLLSFPSFLLFLYLFFVFLFLFLFYLFPFHHLFFFLQVPLSPLRPPLFSSHSIYLLTFPLILPPLSSLPPFPPWVGENNAKRIIFYGHNFQTAKVNWEDT